MSVFRFKQFSVKQEYSAMKVGTDAMLLGSLVQLDNPTSILDVGSGTGVISLMLAQRYMGASIRGIEVDEPSNLESEANYQDSPWNDRLSAVQCDFLLYETDQKFDSIISNPPYYQTRLENEDARKSQARHESALPVAGMVKKVSELLSDNGSFWVIIPQEVVTTWEQNTSKFDLSVATKISIKGKEDGPIKRLVLEFRKEQLTQEERELTIRSAEGKYTDQYIELTKDYHFNNLRATTP